MTTHTLIITLTMVSALLLGSNANAQGSCVFYASDSTFYFTPTVSTDIYSHGPISFVWEPDTGRVLGGYYPQRVVWHFPVITYFNNIVSGSITPGPVGSSLNLSLTMRFTRTVPNTYGADMTNATLTGTTAAAHLSGLIDGPHLMKATGTVTCN